MKKIYLISLALIAVILIALPTVAQANLLTNAGFDSDTGMPPSSWTILSGGYGGGVESPGWARSSANVLKYWSSGGETYTCQDFSVVEGTSYAASVWAYAASDDIPQNFEAYLKIEFPGYQVESARFDGSVQDVWTQLTAMGTAPAGATSARFTLVFGDLDDPNAGAIAFDDAEVDAAAVPEPASLLLLGSGLAGLFSMVRRKK